MNPLYCYKNLRVKKENVISKWFSYIVQIKQLKKKEVRQWDQEGTTTKGESQDFNPAI